MSMRVLIADEHVTFREFLKSFLFRIPGFQVAGEASDGVEAVELVAQLKPDLVLMDIDMSRMDGLEAARRIKARNDGTSVVLLSAVADEAHRQAAHRFKGLFE
jgi:DNA-binding NarL/FixJ family response regulator